MTFLQSAKYVGYGFFGMILFGSAFNKVFAAESNPSLTCIFSFSIGGVPQLACGSPNRKHSGTHWCLIGEDADKSMNDTATFWCTTRHGEFAERRKLQEQKAYKDIQGTTTYPSPHKGSIVPLAPSHDF